MATVQITASVIHNRKVLKPGTILTVPDDISKEEADNLIRIGVAEASPVDTTTYNPPADIVDDIADKEKAMVPTDPQERLAAIAEASKGLDPDNAELWTKGGLPQVKAIEDVLGYDITAEERNEAWERVQEASAIKAIQETTSIDELEALWIEDEDRQSVIDAYNEKMTELEGPEV